MKKIAKIIKICLIVTVVIVMISALGTAVFASGSGDVAGAIESTWNKASVQIKEVVNSVVFPVIDVILAVCFFAKLSLVYFDYKKTGHFEWTAPAILFACLIFIMTAPLYLWNIVGL